MLSFLFAPILASAVLGATLDTRQSIWQPAVGAKVQIVLSNVVTSGTPSDANIFVIDLFDTPVSTISNLKSGGKKVICYFSAGTSENWRPDYKSFTATDQGDALKDWEGENYVNLKSANVVKIMKARIQKAKNAGCNGVDLDNVDAYTTDDGGGFGLTQADSVTFMRTMAKSASSLGLSIGLKNAPDILPQVSDVIQWAINEACKAYDECALYDTFLKTKPVFHIEYATHSDMTTIASVRSAYCQEDTASKRFSTIIKTRALDGWVMYCDGSAVVTPANSG
ncbi:endo alpha-1,4 polygalactosaminidase [Tothia fuscella]|uniref:alpha-galactosidase n=1 Tax=Tothia fuscella TaxID=1048955 RepID=A0A9P4NMQ2_9PEZI|nr:endo alpha-1,4 polygalactosaminidase [Tothia fuscella]